MQAVTITQINFEDLKHLIDQSIKEALSAKQSTTDPTPPADKIMSVNEASEFLDIAVPTVYAKVHRNELPHMKRGGKLYFSRAELMDYLKEGKRKTSSEIKAEAVAFISNHKKSLNNGK